MAVTVEQLMLAGESTHVVEIPPHILAPVGDGDETAPARVVIRPLLLSDVQRIQKAGRDGTALTSMLMVAQALVEPKLSLEQVGHLHAGLVELLLREVNRISGLSLTGDELEELVRAPLARACFILAREFGWTPTECAGMTLGQVLIYLEMLGRGEGSWSSAA